jgi:crotonobetainyl-CoA:carnitine CoA-transferase CaiB-like acyl-CoA transferase
MRPLEGIRVLEVAMYGFVPSAGAVLAEWGADVVKVEHAVTGDPQRGLRQTGLLRVEGDPNPNIEHANRCKRSLGLDMSVPEGKEVLYELARRSDVFLTSFLPGHRKKFGIDVDDIRAVNPKIIYARGSALGPRGAESGKGGYDMTAFWCRAGTAATITPAGMEGMIAPPDPPTATPSPAPTSPAGSPRRCSNASGPVNRRSWTSRCWAAASGRWDTRWR